MAPSPPSSLLDAFKDRSGRWRTRSLFVEYRNPDYPAIFTLGEEDKTIDGTTYISAKRKYLEHQDPTEHKFALSVFGSYPCWQAVCASPELSPYIEQWRKELELHLRSRGFELLRMRAEGGDTAAAKALAIGKFPSRNPSEPRKEAVRTAGRPRKTGGLYPRKTYRDATGTEAGSESLIGPLSEAAYERLFPKLESKVTKITDVVFKPIQLDA